MLHRYNSKKARRTGFTSGSDVIVFVEACDGSAICLGGRPVLFRLQKKLSALAWLLDPRVLGGNFLYDHRRRNIMQQREPCFDHGSPTACLGVMTSSSSGRRVTSPCHLAGQMTNGAIGVGSATAQRRLGLNMQVRAVHTSTVCNNAHSNEPIVAAAYDPEPRTPTKISLFHKAKEITRVSSKKVLQTAKKKVPKIKQVPMTRWSTNGKRSTHIRQMLRIVSTW